MVYLRETKMSCCGLISFPISGIVISYIQRCHTMLVKRIASIAQFLLSVMKSKIMRLLPIMMVIYSILQIKVLLWVMPNCW